MSRLSTQLEAEFEDEYELEDEFEDEEEGEFEGEGEDEAFLGALGGIARTVGGLLGEEEDEDELEFEDEFEEEGEDEAFLGALGGIARTVGGLLGEEEDEDELEFEDEDEAEEFFKKARRLLRKASPFLRILAKTAGPLVATAVGGPAAGMLARAATRHLEGESEWEAEWESEWEAELEAEFEDMATAPLPGAQALGEYFAAQAATAASESEAEAFAGVAAYVSLSPRDRRQLEQMLPALLRGAAVVTRLLRTDHRTRSAVRLVPGIVDATGRTLARRAAAGEPLRRADVGAVMGATTRRVLAGGPARTAVVRRHARGLAHVRRHRRPTWSGSAARRGARRPLRTAVVRRRGTGTLYRTPARSRVTTAARVGRPRPGFVRVVTPVRVPPRGGAPARTVRVVSDVRVPRGAVSAGRPVSVPGARRRTR